MKKLNLFAMVLGFLTVTSANTASADPRFEIAPKFETEIHTIKYVTQWGGEGISLQVIKSADKARAKITFDCASAKIDQVILDKTGGFLASGTYTQRSGARPQHEPVPQPAHFVGFASKGVMSMMVVLDTEPGRSATYTLKKGSFGHLMMCE